MSYAYPAAIRHNGGVYMVFTKNIILEILRPYRGKNYLSKTDNQSYRWASLLPSSTGEMDEDILYICYLSEALRCQSETEGFRYLCIQDRYFDDNQDDIERVLQGMIVLNENREISWLVNLIQNRLLQISEWVLTMQKSLVNNCSFQKLLDLSEPILGNFVAVLDTSYKLLACTKNIQCKDPINISLVEKGYHTEETIKILQAKRRFEFYNENDYLYTTPAGYISHFETVGKWCRFRGVLVIQVIMECSTTPLSLGMLDLFDMLMEAVNECYQRDQYNPNPNQIYNSLFNDILFNDLQNPMIIAERAKSANVSMTGIFDVYRIVFEDNVIVLVGRLAQELMSVLPGAKIITHLYEIIVLNLYTREIIQEASAANVSQLRPLLEKYHAICGVSSSFNNLSDLKNAYIQASRAQLVGCKLRNLGNPWGLEQSFWKNTVPVRDRQVFYYNDMCLYFMLDASTNDQHNLFSNNFYFNALQKLINYDKLHKTNLIQILYIFLHCERRATSAGNLLHMHRNNVLYHIAHIEEIMNIDLSDHQTRLNLNLAFCLAEINNSTTC